MQLTSVKNPLLQNIRMAAAAGRLTEQGLVVAEGPHLLKEALRGEWRVEQVLTTADGRDRYTNLLRGVDAEVLELSSRAFASIAATETTQEVMALVRPREWSWGDLMSSSTLLVALDGIQDPGNAGTIVRSAEAFGAAGVIFLRGCSRVSNGKLLRATAGSIFRMPFLEEVTPGFFVEQIRRFGLTLYALAAQAETSLTDADFRGACALAVGNEARGLSPELVPQANAISISTAKVESLNAAIACSIALFEAQRQRNKREPI
ncbi:MAG: RNA methyltransferase [Bryobacteraceae bacterium]